MNKPIVAESDPPKQLPWLLFLQGGPGGACAPVRQGSWTSFFLDKGYKLLFMDQRGTGLSTTITTETLIKRGDPQAQADYLKHFRADNIIRDAEAIRKVLTKYYPTINKKWSILGQSFGGFCSIHYLSFYPESLREVFATGGMAPMVRQPDALYAKLLQKAIEMNKAYYAKFPEDIARVHQIVEHVSTNKIKTTNGGLLTPYRIQNLGMLLLSLDGWETLHNLFLRASTDLSTTGEILRPTMMAIEQQVPFDNAILYAIIHEACYLSGSASNWSAERALAANQSFNISQTPKDQPIMLTVENITHGTFAAYESLQKILPAAEIIASYDQWPKLYDEVQLAKNTVPVYASIYVDDLAIDFEMAVRRAKSIGNCKTYITNQSWHGGLKEHCDEVLGALFALRDDVMA